MPGLALLTALRISWTTELDFKGVKAIISDAAAIIIQVMGLLKISSIR